MLIVSVSITVSVHASVSISALVTVYCYFRHPGALPPPSPQLLQLPFCSVISSTGSLSDPLSPEAEKCHPEKAAQPSGGCTGTSRLSSILPWRCTKPHRGTKKHSSQAEKRRENSLPISRSGTAATAAAARTTATAAITTNTTATIFLDHQRHRKSQQSPLPKG